MSKCDTCSNKPFGYLCDGCKYDPDATDKYVPMSKGDMIRSMSDEEMAASKNMPCPYIQDEYDECKFGWHTQTQTCEECKLEWLQSPVTK